MVFQNSTNKHIAILGSFSGRNKGDLAILRSMLIQLRNNCKHLTVHLFSTERSQLNEYLRDIVCDSQAVNSICLKIHISLNGYIGLETVPVLLKCHQVIIGGGGLFFDTKLLNPFFSHVLNLFFITIFLRLLHKPIFLFAVGCSHLNSKISRVLTRFIINSAQVITVRDQSSKSQFSCLTSKNIIEGADPAFLLNSSETYRAKTIVDRWPRGKKILLVLNRFMFLKFRIPDRNLVLEQFVSSVNQFARQNDYTVLTYANRTKQNFACHIAHNLSSQGMTALQAENHLLPEELIFLFSKVDFVIATNMHACIFALLAGVPLLSIVYDKKVEELNRQIGSEHFLYITELRQTPKVMSALEKASKSAYRNRKLEVIRIAKKLVYLLTDFLAP